MPPIPLPMIAALLSSANMTNCLHTILQIVFKMYSKGQFWVYVYLITVLIICLVLLMALYLSSMLWTHFFHSCSWSFSEEKMKTFCLDKFNNLRVKHLFVTSLHIGLCQDCFIKEITSKNCSKIAPVLAFYEQRYQELRNCYSLGTASCGSSS